MWSRLFGTETPAPTHFSSSSELIALATLMDELRAKKNNLEKIAAKEGGDSIAFRKHTFVSELLISLEKLIKKFNRVPKQTSKIDEYEIMAKLASDIHDTVTYCLQRHSVSLNMHRRDTDPIHGTIAVSALVLGVWSGFALIGAFFGGASIIAILEQSDTQTFKILTALDETSRKIRDNLNQFITRLSRPIIIKEIMLERMWAAIAFCANPHARQLPLDIKHKILLYLFDDMKDFNAISVRPYDIKLFKAAKAACENREARLLAPTTTENMKVTTAKNHAL